MEQMVLSASNREPFTVSQHFRDLYQGDFDMGRLDTHLKMLLDIIQRYGEITGVPLKKVTNIRTVCQAMKETPGATALCSEIHRFLKLFHIIPATTSTAERTFSALRRIKTYLRSSMTQERLNHLLLHCHKERTDQLDLQQLAKTFLGANERRRHFLELCRYIYIYHVLRLTTTNITISKMQYLVALFAPSQSHQTSYAYEK